MCVFYRCCALQFWRRVMSIIFVNIFLFYEHENSFRVHGSKSLSYIQNHECDVQCLVCKDYSNKISYVCESDHFLYKTCRSTEPIKQGKQDRKADGNINDLNMQNIIDNNDDFKELKIEYKNNNFTESMTTIDSTSMNIIRYRNKKLYKEDECNSIARPVICPVTSCGKMLAIDSIMQHFYFDHSKIANIILRLRKSHRITLKSCNFKSHTQCIGIFEHWYESKHLVETGYSNDNSYPKVNRNQVLLLCALTALNTTKASISEQKNHKETSLSKTKQFDNNDILLIWLCKTSNNTHTYKITLSREDKLLSYSFTGEPIHIRDSQDANSIFNRSDCLIVRGFAANRLLDKYNQFHIFVSIIS